MNHKFYMPEEKEESRFIEECCLCRSRNLVPFAAIAKKAGLLHFAQFRCKNCGLLIAQPHILDNDLERYYREYFYEKDWPDAEAIRHSNIRNYQKQELCLIKHLCSGWLPPVGSSVLEIGCGYGAMLTLLEQIGYRAYGLDISSKAVAFCYSKGFSVVEASSKSIPFKPESFDLVISMYVIEHVNDPRNFMNQTLKLLRPGGVIILITDDADSSQYAFHRAIAMITARVPRLCSSADHSFVFRRNHIKCLLKESGCRDVRLEEFNFIPEHENLHWHIYKSLFRFLDRIRSSGEFIIAAGRKIN